MFLLQITLEWTTSIERKIEQLTFLTCLSQRLMLLLADNDTTGDPVWFESEPLKLPEYFLIMISVYLCIHFNEKYFFDAIELQMQ